MGLQRRQPRKKISTADEGDRRDAGTARQCCISGKAGERSATCITAHNALNRDTSGGHTLLTTNDLTIRFGGHVAVNAVSCTFRPGTLTAIVGPNGAGKTTYFNLISGQLAASSGTVSLNGQDLTGLSASARTRAGLGRAFQLTNLFPHLSVRENVRVAVQATRKGPHHHGLNLWSIWSDHAVLTQRANEILESVALIDKADSDVASLPHGDQRKLEVAMLMALQSDVYMFDEPTAGMSADEMPAVLNLIRELRKDKSKTILLVEHKMDVVRELADRIIVLHNGTLVADGEPAEVIASPIVQEAYLGVAPPPAEADVTP